ncbi:MAG: hypothetical protein FWH27_03010 [Planctomycetaceae bacterium]|nr:hypothetical protein [Planctomycetaceae bacterium]
MDHLRKFNRKIPCWFLLLPGLFCMTACRNEPRPDGLPKLYPATLTFTQEDQPLAEAQVVLVPQDKALAKWVVGGITDAKGVLRVKTHGKFSGAPLGKYKMTVSKTEIDQEETVRRGNVDANITRFVDLVDAKFQTVELSPLEIEITTGKNASVFDLGQPVRTPVPLPSI